MTTEEKTSRSVENPYATTNKKPSPSAFVIWLIATIVLLGGAITLGIFTCIWGDYYQDYKRGYEVAKMELEQPCDEFEDFIDACKSGEYDNFDDLEPYWDRYLKVLESRSYYTHYAIAYDVMKEHGSNFSSIEWLARETKFSAYVYNNDYNASYNAIQPEYADKFEKALREECNGALQRQMNDCERWAKNDLFVLIVAFLIPGVICLTVGIIGIFVTIKQHKKLKKGRAAYENAVLAHAIAEEKQKSDMLLIMEAMQKKIDALEGKAPMEVTSQSTMQTSPKRAEDILRTTSSSQQDTSAPTSSNASKTINKSNSFTSSKRGLIEVLEDIQDDKEGFVKFLLVVVFAPLKLVIRTITLPSMCAALSKANKASKEIAAEYNALKAEGYENASRRKAREAYEKANTSQEKMEFFYGYFSSAENCKKPTLCAYIMTYLAENSSLFDKNDPLKLAPYFTADVDKALYSLLRLNPKEMPHGRYYEHLLRTNNEERGSDKYILQCLIIAANGGEGDSIPLYKYDILGQECVPEDAE